MSNNILPQSEKKRLLKRVAIVSLIFTVVIGLFFILNFIQLKTADPLNSPALAKLYTELAKNPANDELRQQIRSLDLLARKAYFTKQWQIHAGIMLMLAGLILFFVSYKLLHKSDIKDITVPEIKDKTWEDQLLAKKWTALTGVIIFGAALILSLITKHELASATFIKTESLEYSAPSQQKIKENWPNFRGPWGQGIAYHDNVPKEWDGESGKNILWKQPIPKPGFNSPIMWDDRLYFAGADRDGEQIYCYDADKGDLLWQKDITNIPGSPSELPDVTEDTGFAASTMATDGNYVFAIFATGNLVCLNKNGALIWGKNLGLPDNHYGHSSSLIMHENLLLVLYDHADDGSIMGINPLNGNIEWKAPRDMGITWSSPLLAKTVNGFELIINANPFVVSYNPVSGQENWRIECMGGEVAPSPAYANNMVFVGNDNAELAGITIGAEVILAWEYDDDLPEVSSPVATDKYVFVATSWGTVSCLDAETGTQVWTNEFDEGFYSSPIIVGDNVYLLDMEGTMQIFKVDGAFQLVASSSLGEKSTAIPVFMDKRIYIRGEENLFCIGE